MVVDLPNANSRIKKGVADALNVDHHTFDVFVDLKIHDIDFRFYIKSEAVLEQLYRIYPVDWFVPTSNPICVYWLDNRDFGFTDEQWEDSPSYECSIVSIKNKIYAIQRDFLGIKHENKLVLVTSYTLGDGFYNFLRWAMPLHFIQTQKYLLHSSCVLDPYKQAHFCFGPSGAGKTTISSLAPRSRVLGDDMNVLKIENGKCWAQAGALGQALTNSKEYGKWYPVVGLYWLEKSRAVQLESLSQSDQFLKLSSSIANVFWPHLTMKEVEMIMRGVTDILNITELKKLAFPIDANVWPTLWSLQKNMSMDSEVVNAL